MSSLPSRRRHVLTLVFLWGSVAITTAIAIQHSLHTFREHSVGLDFTALLRRPAVWGLLALLPLLTFFNLFGRYFRWVFLLRAFGRLVPSRELLLAYLASFIGNLVPFHLPYLIRLIPLSSDLPAGFGVLLLDLAMDAVAILVLARAGVAAPVAAIAVGLAALLLVARLPSAGSQPRLPALQRGAQLALALSASVLIWSVTSVALWCSVRALGGGLSWPHLVPIFARSQQVALTSLLPPAISETGTALIGELMRNGLGEPVAVYATAVLRAGTFWVTVLVAALAMLAYARWRGAPRGGSAHFDHIAEHYSSNFAQHMRLRYVSTKMAINASYLPAAAYRTGIDAGCGQGWYVADMRRRGYAVAGFDLALSQVRLAKQVLGGARGAGIAVGSMTEVPVRSDSMDFVYCINVVHHLGSPQMQERAFREALRILRPGGRFIVHEMNVLNPFFRLYLGYLFPLFKDIDEGTEIWLRNPARSFADGFTLVATEYRTFLPEFLPEQALRALAPVEEFLERRPHLRRWAAHVSYVLEKPESADRTG